MLLAPPLANMEDVRAEAAGAAAASRRRTASDARVPTKTPMASAWGAARPPAGPLRVPPKTASPLTPPEWEQPGTMSPSSILSPADTWTINTPQTGEMIDFGIDWQSAPKDRRTSSNIVLVHEAPPLPPTLGSSLEPLQPARHEPVLDHHSGDGKVLEAQSTTSYTHSAAGLKGHHHKSHAGLPKMTQSHSLDNPTLPSAYGVPPPQIAAVRRTKSSSTPPAAAKRPFSANWAAAASSSSATPSRPRQARSVSQPHHPLQLQQPLHSHHPRPIIEDAFCETATDVSASPPKTPLTPTSPAEMASIAEAAAVALRRRTRSAPKGAELDLEDISRIEQHRRSASDGGDRSLPSPSPRPRPRSSSRSSVQSSRSVGSSHSGAPKRALPPPPPLPPVPHHPRRQSVQARLRSPPPPPFSHSRPAPPPPPPSLAALTTKQPRLMPSPTPIDTTNLKPPPMPTVARDVVEPFAESLAALREAESWEWPLPPSPGQRIAPLQMPKRRAAQKQEVLNDAAAEDDDWIDDAVTPVAIASRYGARRDSESASSVEAPMRGSSAMSSEMGPLTPDDVSDDPFDPATRPQLPPHPLFIKRMTGALPPRPPPRRSYGVPF